MHRPLPTAPDAPPQPPRPHCADCRAWRPWRLPRRQRRLGPLRDQPPLLLRQCSVEVQHEGICISPQFGNDERHTLGHQARYEGHVAGKPVELGHDDRAFLLPPCGQRCGQLGPSVEGIAPLPRFHLDELADQIEPLGRGEPGDRLALGLDAEPGSALPGGGNAVIGNGLLHRDKLGWPSVQNAYHRLRLVRSQVSGNVQQFRSEKMVRELGLGLPPASRRRRAARPQIGEERTSDPDVTMSGLRQVRNSPHPIFV